MFFFFQSEDGIRDIGVTEVRTCALPISRPAPRSPRVRVRPPRPAELQVTATREGASFASGTATDPAMAPHNMTLTLRIWRQKSPADKGRMVTYRSEERRVGKECRSRWSP